MNSLSKEIASVAAKCSDLKESEINDLASMIGLSNEDMNDFLSNIKKVKTAKDQKESEIKEYAEDLLERIKAKK